MKQLPEDEISRDYLYFFYFLFGYLEANFGPFPKGTAPLTLTPLVYL